MSMRRTNLCPLSMSKTKMPLSVLPSWAASGLLTYRYRLRPLAAERDGAIKRNAAARAHKPGGHRNTLKGGQTRARFRNDSRELRRLPGRVCIREVWRKRVLGSIRREGESTSLPRWLGSGEEREGSERTDVHCYRG